jgi:hypothetical protein
VSTEGAQLRLTVTNVMAAGRAGGTEGVGLRNVRERLAVQFGDDAQLMAGERQLGRWVAEIRMPLLREPPGPRGAAD